MKSFKRNAVILTVLLFVCAAVYLNWTYGQRGEEAADMAMEMAEGENAEVTQADAGLYYTAAQAESTGRAAVPETWPRQEISWTVRIL